MSPFLNHKALTYKPINCTNRTIFMNFNKITFSRLSKALGLVSLLSFCSASYSSELTPLVDDFNHATSNSLGITRQFLDDTIAGGKTKTEIKIIDGKLNIKGEIVPPRGQPGWASSVLLLEQQGLPQDASKFKGIRLLLKVDSGNISISANSSEITNFDYHTAPVSVKADGQFHEVKIPFVSMKRTWSEQTSLNTSTISSLSIVSFGLQATSFNYAVDEVGFY